ncbi:MAG: peptidylprolyl isomerase [Gemmatimonadota bacterium]|nr:peptidylprolyl isomerase [Gemmatimonadota bacterium]
MKILLLYLGTQILLSLQFAGCGEQEPVVARIGDAEIAVADFKRFVGNLPPELQSEKQGRDADLDYLNSMVDQELLLMEARSRGIDTSAAIATQLQDLIRLRLAGRYRAQVIDTRIKIAAEDIQRAFVDMGFNRERLYSRILLYTREEVDEVMQQLGHGRTFEEMARRFADHDAFAQEDGTMDWIGRTQAERFGISKQDFFSLAVGQVAEPLRMPGFWQIYRFLDDREAKLEKYQQEIGKKLYREQQRIRTQEEFEVLSRKYGLRLHPEGIRLLVRPNLDLTPAEAARPLYSFSGGKMTLEDYLNQLRSKGFRGGLTDSLQVVKLAEISALHPWLFARAGREQGWDEELAFVEWRQRKNKELILKALMEAETTARMDLNETVLRDFYEADPGRFRNAAEVTVREIWVHTEEEARGLRAEIERGADIAELLRRPDVHSHGSLRRGGELVLRHLLRPAYPALVDAAFAAQEGDLVGPVALEGMGAFAIFRVLEHKDSRIRTFEEAQRQVRARVRAEQERELSTDFLKRLQEKYRDQIELFVERLE